MDLGNEKYQLFRSHPHHPSFHVKIVRATEKRTRPHWEYRINRNYRATCHHDGDGYVWVFIGSHKEFELFYR
ncbi:MAG: hypothetical protein AUJ92_07005 [Armatimonadetes bacterium CG2_30_59_28]|nr:MAG: hypothetical protein AUJ92_07005 [Armatimonadetes bacterium CG2_30_59_28]PIU67280.1 MAG: hypothetical protein COS85_01315 [Armatimonadetes bacterium CG07_land_8_20_14_0_80_59_28]